MHAPSPQQSGENAVARDNRCGDHANSGKRSGIMCSPREKLLDARNLDEKLNQHTISSSVSSSASLGASINLTKAGHFPSDFFGEDAATGDQANTPTTESALEATERDSQPSTRAAKNEKQMKETARNVGFQRKLDLLRTTRNAGGGSETAKPASVGEH